MFKKVMDWVKAVWAAIVKWFTALDTELDADVAKVETVVKADITDVKADVNVVKTEVIKVETTIKTDIADVKAEVAAAETVVQDIKKVAEDVAAISDAAKSVK